MKTFLRLTLACGLLAGSLLFAGCEDPGPATRGVQHYFDGEGQRWNELKDTLRRYCKHERQKWPKLGRRSTQIMKQRQTEPTTDYRKETTLNSPAGESMSITKSSTGGQSTTSVSTSTF